jgi:hypothetical protein
MTAFKDFDFSDFWDYDDYALEYYEEKWPTDEIIASVEEELGYKLPASYIELMRIRNGGMPRKTAFLCEAEDDEVFLITGIFGIGREKDNSLCGEMGSQFWMEEWGYPDIGVYICDTPSAGHDMILLDYRECGPTGEPKVSHVDQESGDYPITVLASDFETFIKGLKDEEDYGYDND